VIQLFHVKKAYPGDAPVLDDITLRVEKGEFVWLTGPSGAGKSTLLKLLFCAESPTSGQILIGGRNIGRIGQGSIPYLRRNIGVVFQDFKLLDNRTILENVGYALEVLGASDGEIRERSLKRLAQVGLDHRATSLPRRLSGGEQQRLRVAQALVSSPSLLLADEPLLSLDLAHQRGVVDLLDARRLGAGTPVVFVTHDINPVLHSVDRVLYLAPGSWAIGTPDEVLTSQTLSRLYDTEVDVLRVRGRVVVVGTPDDQHVHHVGEAH